MPISPRKITVALANALLFSALGSAQEPAFRFITQTLPAGSRNAVYTAQILTAHAKGPVSFGLASGALPDGLRLDATTGLLTGRPTQSSNFNLSFSANDGQSTLQLPVDLQISSSGGGGNGAFTFDTLVLPEARVGEAYAASLQTSGGVGPFVFGAAHLPPGLRFDGASGAISGTPRAAGTYEVLLCAVDRGEGENKVATILPLLVRPESSEFRYASQTLDNGAVGASYECTPILSAAPNGLEHSATGLPPGLAIDPASGSIAGTPTTAGTFEVELRVRGGGDELQWNTRLRIVPSGASALHWNDFALPIAMAGIPYDRQPAILLDASGASTPSYAAEGLPIGISYAASSGALAGTAYEVGVFPVTFRVTSGGGAEELLLRTEFAVLPSSGGSVEEIAAPIWISKLQVKPGTGNADGSWKASLLLNSDRRDSVRFDSAEDGLAIELGGTRVEIPSGAFDTSGFAHDYVFRDGALSIAVGYDLATERLDLSASGLSWTDALPGTLDLRLHIGAQSRRLRLQLDERGRFRATADLRSSAFVISRASLTRDGSNRGALALDALLGDPAFAFDPLVDPLRMRVRHEETLIVERDLGSVASVKTKRDARSGALLYQIATPKEPAGPAACTGLRYESGKGRLRVGFVDLDLASLPASPSPAQLSIELVVGTRVYVASATFFEQRPGSYALTAR
ncbi:MAG: putative Ig domain-containing protein [Planctomycetes bacterium]|nr:putative Ig domain-containing protein [Planctomycetota bacterium]